MTAVVLGLLSVPAAGAALPQREVAAFYYPWYGNPHHDGDYRHWQQRGMRPPDEVASAFYPSRGLYSSADRLVLGAQVAEMGAAGIDVLVSSWWGQGSFEDARLPGIQAAAARAGLRVAVHLEPYPGRSPESTRSDIEYLLVRGIFDFYLYGAHERPAEEWWDVARIPGARVFAQTWMAGYAAKGGFAGLYTYDVLVQSGAGFGRMCAAARRWGLLCVPSVGPGYHAVRAVGDPRVRLRRAGRTYDGMWRAAILAEADAITITSYNEWHEGTQIEPARPFLALGSKYLGYEGAWGRKGRAAETAYLDRTAFWSARFRRAATRAGAGIGR